MLINIYDNWTNPESVNSITSSGCRVEVSGEKCSFILQYNSIPKANKVKDEIANQINEACRGTHDR